jgi:hypothetical protein
MIERNIRYLFHFQNLLLIFKSRGMQFSLLMFKLSELFLRHRFCQLERLQKLCMFRGSFAQNNREEWSLLICYLFPTFGLDWTESSLEKAHSNLARKVEFEVIPNLTPVHWWISAAPKTISFFILSCLTFIQIVSVGSAPFVAVN